MKHRFPSLARALLGPLALFAQGACTATSVDTGSVTHLPLLCAIQRDCPEGALCEYGVCTLDGEPLPQGDEVSVSSFSQGLTLGSRLDAEAEGDAGAIVNYGDFALIRDRGFDHVRLPVRFSAYLVPPSAVGEAASLQPWIFERLDKLFEVSLDIQVPVVLAWARFEELADGSAEQRQYFLDGWRLIAEKYADRSDLLAFEVLDNPNTPLEEQTYNDLMAQALDLIRAQNPDRLVLIRAQETTTKLSADDPHLWAAVGFGGPDLFTFQGQEWAGEPFQTTGIVYPGPPPEPVTPVPAAANDAEMARWFDEYNTWPLESNPCGPDYFRHEVEVLEQYRGSGYPVYVDTWGSWDGADPDSRIRWTTDARVALESLRWVRWAHWEDGGGLKLFDSDLAEWDEPLTRAILGEPED